MCTPVASTTEQTLPPEAASGVEVLARGWPWRVDRIWRSSAGRVIEIGRLDRDAPSLAALLDPFDRIRALAVGSRWRAGSVAGLAQQIARLGSAWPDQPLCAFSSMRVPLWTHQTAPARAIVRGRATRLLVADEVGLGKTLSAALVVAELTKRGICRRALIVVPAGLRDQWREELDRRAGIRAEVVDAAALVARVRLRPSREPAWSAPGVAIVSVDFARQPSVLAGLAAWSWDVLVVDEAHQVSTDSARAAAIARIAARSRTVLLLTATPHSGDPGAYRRLLSLGGNGSPALCLRHRRGEVDAGLALRRTRRWRIRSTPIESRLLDSLAAYARRVDRIGGPEARLAMIVLRKRALSSAAALVRSLEHRRAALGGVTGEQLALPLDVAPGEHDLSDSELPLALAAPGLADRAGELAVLERLVELAHAASIDSSKWRALDRLIRRTAEPMILFTEFRDTLSALVAHLCDTTSLALLHGGLDRAERADAVSRFTHGHARVLIATDAAAEGLNLQAGCRLLVNIELPWSPRVLEQRAGRIDRIGQRLPVHVWELAGRSGHEGMVTAALARRLAAIQSDLGAPLTVGIDRGLAPAVSSPEGESISSAALAGWWHLQQRVRRPAGPASNRRRARGGVWILARHAATHLGRGVLLVFSTRGERSGAAPQHVAVHVAMSCWPPGSPSGWLSAVADAARPVAASALEPDDELRRSLAARESELLAFAVSAHSTAARRWQPSFFDRRAARVIDAVRRDLNRITAEHENRAAELNAPATPARLDPVFALLVR